MSSRFLLIMIGPTLLTGLTGCVGANWLVPDQQSSLADQEGVEREPPDSQAEPGNSENDSEAPSRSLNSLLNDADELAEIGQQGGVPQVTPRELQQRLEQQMLAISHRSTDLQRLPPGNQPFPGSPLRATAPVTSNSPPALQQLFETAQQVGQSDRASAYRVSRVEPAVTTAVSTPTSAAVPVSSLAESSAGEPPESPAEPTPEVQLPPETLDSEEAIASKKWQAHLDETIRQLEQELADEHDPQAIILLETHLRLAYVLANRRNDAVRSIEQLSENESEYWKHLAHGLLVALDSDRRHVASRKSALSLRHLRTATNHLANSSTLDVRNLSFCKEVVSYGNYEEFKPSTFRPGSEVALYVEVENFTVASVGDKHETELQGEYAILNEHGERVISRVLPLDKQLCNNRRRDYFIAYRLFLPESIEPGVHNLVLTMTDLKGKKSNQASVEFRIR